LRGDKLILVGDNPFHGISHLSQARARGRDPRLADPCFCADLVASGIISGANGFMFSISWKTLNILKCLSKKIGGRKIYLTPITPYAYEYVRKATVTGTVGLIKEIVFEVLKTFNLRAVINAVKAVYSKDLVYGLRMLIDYDLGRIKRFSGLKPYTLMLHEIIVDTLIPYGLTEPIVEALYYIKRKNIIPGIETRNLPRIFNALKEYPNILEDTIFSTAFNKIGFQMAPSKESYEKIVLENPNKVIAFSILASGYLKPAEALEYIGKYKDSLLGVAVGVSKHKHVAIFSDLKRMFTP
jgi:hypothetical protein